MKAVAAAMMLLFSGQNLDGWITLAGKWVVADKAMVCQSAPGSIRSTYESDHFILRFKYRGAGNGLNRVFVHSKMSTGGTELELTPGGVASPGKRPEAAPAPAEEWLSVEVEVGPGRLWAAASRADGTRLSQVEQAVDTGARGFIRFEATQPGLQLRDLEVQEPGFTAMFDGKTLEGWEVSRSPKRGEPTWLVEDGIVKCPGRTGAWIRTLRTYDNFVLRLEYQLPPRGNSGIYLRAPIEGRVSRIGLEIQLLDDLAYRGKLKPAQFTGSIYDGIAPEVQVPAPVNEWNAIEITCDGNRVRTILNGIQLYDARLDDASKDTNHEVRPLATRRTVGFVGLQDHSSLVMFRNLRIRELPR